MHSERELIRLAAVKAALRHDIARHRHQCVTAAARVVEPLLWLDRGVALWRRLAPYAAIAVPLGFLLKRAPTARPGLLGTLFRWAPVVAGALRGFTRARAPRD